MNRQTSTPDSKVNEFLARYDTPDGCAAELLCDTHEPSAIAFTVISPDLSSHDLTYGELAEKSRRFASALDSLGVQKGDCVAVLMAKSENLVVALLGIWRLGAVHVPLFTAFGTPAIELRVNSSGAKVIVVDPDQRHKIATLSSLTVMDGENFNQIVRDHPPIAKSVSIGGRGTLVQLFTSGTTGNPKGVPVPLRALAAFRSYLYFGLDVRDDDVYWNGADPGWAYGLYYGILGPLAAGQRNLLLHAGFSAELTGNVLRKFGVTNFASAPTVYRSLSKEPSVNGLHLRCASSAGEPLTPDVNLWAKDALGVEVRDQFGQTEQGMLIANAWNEDIREPVKPGSMGRQLPGYNADIIDGKVAIDTTASPLMWFTGYVNAPEKTAQRFTDDGRWYLTGDAGSVDEEGAFFFSSRDDDVIIMAGYRIGPFDVESVLITHDSVAEAAVVGKPDELRGEVLEAYVVLEEGCSGSDELVLELQKRVKTQFAAHAYPRKIHFVDELPKTPSGKIQRYILRQLKD